MSNCQWYTLQLKLEELEQKLNRRLDGLERSLRHLERIREDVNYISNAMSDLKRDLDGLGDLSQKIRAWAE